MNKKDIALKNAHGIRRGDVWYGSLDKSGPREWVVTAVGGLTVLFSLYTRKAGRIIGGARCASPEWVKANMRRTRKAK